MRTRAGSASMRRALRTIIANPKATEIAHSALIMGKT
jgi:hypothetical protein